MQSTSLNSSSKKNLSKPKNAIHKNKFHEKNYVSNGKTKRKLNVENHLQQKQQSHKTPRDVSGTGQIRDTKKIENLNTAFNNTIEKISNETEAKELQPLLLLLPLLLLRHASASRAQNTHYVLDGKKITSDQYKSLHLYNLTHAVPNNPLHRQFSLRYETLNCDKLINVPPILEHKICMHCGVLQIPGINQTHRIDFGKKNKKKKKQKNKSAGEVVVKKENDKKEKDKDEDEDEDEEGETTRKNQIRRLRYKCLFCKNVTYSEPLLIGNMPREKNTKKDGQPLNAINLSNKPMSNELKRAERESSADTINAGQFAKSNLTKSEAEAEAETETTGVNITTGSFETNVNKENPVFVSLKQETELESLDSTKIDKKNKQAKARAKKRKAGSDLLGMLKQRKLQQETKEQKANSLSLMDFMQ